MLTQHSNDGTVANNVERLLEIARLQQDIVQLEGYVRNLQGGICPFSGQRLDECAHHAEKHLPQIKAQAALLTALKKKLTLA